MTIPGVAGHLVSRSYLASRLAGELEGSRSVANDLAEACTRAIQLLGPASSLQTLLDVGLLPLLAALGHDRCSNFYGSGPVLVGIAGSPLAATAVVVSPWGDSLDHHWRAAVVAARQRGAAWALLFNGTHLRIV